MVHPRNLKPQLWMPEGSRKQLQTAEPTPKPRHRRSVYCAFYKPMTLKTDCTMHEQTLSISDPCSWIISLDTSIQAIWFADSEKYYKKHRESVLDLDSTSILNSSGGQNIHNSYQIQSWPSFGPYINSNVLLILIPTHESTVSWYTMLCICSTYTCL